MKILLYRCKKLFLVACVLCLVACVAGCGSRYLAEKLYWQANQVVKEIIQNRPLDKLTAEDYQKIITTYREVVEKCPLEPLAAQSQFIIAQLYVLQGQYSKAQKELLRITQNFSAKSEIASRAQFMIGNLYERQGDWEKAISEYEKVIELYPLSSLGLKTPIYIAQHYQRSQENSQVERTYKKAVRNYEKIINDYSGTSVAPIVMDYLALAHFSQGKWDKAIEVWQEIANEYSHSPIAEKSLLASGEIYARQIRDLQKAIQIYEDFVKQYPRSQVKKEVKFQIGKLYFNKGDTQKAKQVFLQIIRDYPRQISLCTNARVALAACYEREGNSKKAIEEYHKLRKDYPDTKLALAVPFFIARHYLISEVDRDKAEAAFAQAVSEYKKIVEEETDSSLAIEAGRLISLCYIQQKRWNEAIDSLYNLVVKYPDNPGTQMFMFNIADIYQKELGKPQRAMQIYEELIDKYPDSHPLVNLAKMRVNSLQKDISKGRVKD